MTNPLGLAAALAASAIAGTAFAAPPPQAAPASIPPAPPPPGVDRGPGTRWMGDVDGDGRISQAEYMAKASADFARIDANHDGYVDAAERELARQAMRVPGGPGHHRGGWRDGPPPPPGDAPPPPPPSDDNGE